MQKPSTGNATTECLGHQLAIEFLENQLNLERQQQVSLHLENCASCRAMLDQLTDDASLRAYRDSAANGGSADCNTLIMPFTSPAGAEQASFEGRQSSWQFPVADRDDSPTQFGRFRIQERLGEGGFGVVFLAHDELLKRNVALKLPHVSAYGSDELRRRFLQEGQAAAGLHHPNIVPIYESGIENGTCYLASAYCAGPSLAEWLRECGPVDALVAAQLVRQLADAVEQAHRQGILHRDIKPANVLLDESLPGLELAFTPKLTDFGMAKLMDDRLDLTVSGVVCGTPRYMAPEQAAGNSRDVGPATDVYALGAILYELLTGQPVVSDSDQAGQLHRVIHSEPLRPRHLRRDLSADLEAICLKCLEKLPSRRYATAAALREDLQRWLEGRPTRARPLSPAGRAIRWCSRQPVLTASLLVGLAAVVLSVAGLLFHNYTLDAALRRAKQERERAEASERQTRDLLYAADMRMAFVAWQRSEPDLLRENLRRWLPTKEQPDRRGVEWYLLNQTVRRPRSFVAHTGAIYSSALSPDGLRLATAGEDHTIRLWDVNSHQQVGELAGHQGEVNDVCWSADGRLLASASDDATVCIWDAQLGRLARQLPIHGDVVFAVAFSPDGQVLASGDKSGRIRLWTIAGQVTEECSERHGPVDDLTFTPDGQLLVAAIGEQVQLRRAVDLELVTALKDSKFQMSCVAVSPDNRLIAAGGRDNPVFVWALATCRLTHRLEGHVNWVHDVTFSHDSQSLATSSRDGTARVWPLRQFTRQDAVEVPGVDHALDLAPDGSQFVTVDSSGNVQSWDATGQALTSPLAADSSNWKHVAFAPNGRSRAVFDGRTNELLVFRAGLDHPSTTIPLDCAPTLVALGPTGKTLAIGCQAEVSIWDLASGRRQHRLDGPTKEVQCLAYSADGRYVAAGGKDRVAHVWEVTNGQTLMAVKHGKSLHCLRFVGSSQQLLTGDSRGVLRVWDVETSQLLKAVQAHDWPLADAAVCSEGTLAATVAGDGSISLWDIPSWRCLQTLNVGSPLRKVRFHPEGTKLSTLDDRGALISWHTASAGRVLALEVEGQRVWSANFSLDDATLMTTDQLGRVECWPIENPHPGNLLTETPHAVYDLAFDPSGQRLALAGVDQSIVAWDLQQGREKLVSPQGCELASVTYSGDGRWIAAGAFDGRILLWDGQATDLNVQLKAHTGMVAALAAARNHPWLASAGHDGVVRIWDLDARDIMQEFRFESRPSSLAFSPDDQWLAVDAEQSVALWSMSQQKITRRLEGCRTSCESLAFHPSGTLLCSGHADHVVRLWDLTNDRQLYELRGHTKPLTAVTISTDGRTLATAALDGTVRLWHVASGQELGVLYREANGPMRALEFSANGQYLAAGKIGHGQGGRVLLWKIEQIHGPAGMADPFVADHALAVEEEERRRGR